MNNKKKYNLGDGFTFEPLTDDMIRTLNTADKAKCTSGTATLNPFEQEPKSYFKTEAGRLLGIFETASENPDFPMWKAASKIAALEEKVGKLETGHNNMVRFDRQQDEKIEALEKKLTPTPGSSPGIEFVSTSDYTYTINGSTVTLKTEQLADGRVVLAPQEFIFVNTKTGALRKQFFGYGDCLQFGKDEMIAYWETK